MGSRRVTSLGAGEVGQLARALRDTCTLQWRQNELVGVSNHRRPDCFVIFYSGAEQTTHQSSAWLAFVRGIHQWPVDSPHKECGKYFHLMTSSCEMMSITVLYMKNSIPTALSMTLNCNEFILWLLEYNVDTERVGNFQKFQNLFVVL